MPNKYKFFLTPLAISDIDDQDLRHESAPLIFKFTRE